MPERIIDQPLFENCELMFRNFAGESTQYNPKGIRNFCVKIPDPDIAKSMENDGWNVKYLKPREEGEDPTAYLQVAVSFANVPPKIVLLSSKGRTILDESNVHILDYAEIANVDLIINPYNWSVSGKSGVKAYLKSMYVTIREDALELKYGGLDPNADDSDDIPF